MSAFLDYLANQNNYFYQLQECQAIKVKTIEVIELLNLSNIAHDISGYAQLNPEIIIERNPDFIITPNPSTFKNNPAFQEISAVKNNKIFTLQ